MILKLVCSFFFLTLPMILWRLEPKKTQVILPSKTSIYILDNVTLLHLPGRSRSGRRHRRHWPSHDRFAGFTVAAGNSSDEILDFSDIVNHLEWKGEWNKGILEKTPSLHIVNIEKMPSSNIVYIVDVKIENLYLVGLRTARADIMTAWYRSGHLLGNAGSSLELWLVPILGPLHTADAPLQDRHPSYEYSRLHFHKARTSRGTPDPGWCWWPHCRGAGWSPAQHTNIFDSKQISVQSQSWLQLKNLS